MTTDQFLEAILQAEGGYVDAPSDRGGPTKYGITLPTLAHHRGRPVSVDDLKMLHPTEAKDIYRVEYINALGIDKVPNDRLRALLADYAVTSWDDAVKDLQRAVKVDPDGKLGPRTIKALTEADPDQVYRDVFRLRCDHFIDTAFDRPVRLLLGTNKSTQLHNLKGWLRRLADFA